jgi:hypothetical protein
VRSRAPPAAGRSDAGEAHDATKNGAISATPSLKDIEIFTLGLLTAGLLPL